jgi:hypothetical protein
VNNDSHRFWGEDKVGMKYKAHKDIAMFEKRSHPMLSRGAFALRVFQLFLLTIVFGLISLAAGMLGFHVFEGMDWLESFLNAAMLLGGMGQVDPLHSDMGKFFAGCYALYCGVFVVVCSGLLLAPVFHRVLHHFHVEDDDK